MNPLVLSGQAIPGFDQKISLEGGIRSQNSSENSSRPDQVFGGFEAMVFRCSTTLRNTQQQEIEQIYRLFQATENGLPKVYRIEHPIGRNVKNRTVTFHGKITQSDNYPNYTCTISFQLREYKSLPGDKEAQENESVSSTNTSNAPDTVAIDPELASRVQAYSDANPSFLEKILAGLEQALSDDEEESSGGAPT